MSPKPMVRYRPTPARCPNCGKPLDLARDAIRETPKGWACATVCTAPLRRRPKG